MATNILPPPTNLQLFSKQLWKVLVHDSVFFLVVFFVEDYADHAYAFLILFEAVFNFFDLIALVFERPKVTFIIVFPTVNKNNCIIINTCKFFIIYVSSPAALTKAYNRIIINRIGMQRFSSIIQMLDIKNSNLLKRSILIIKFLLHDVASHVVNVNSLAIRAEV